MTYSNRKVCCCCFKNKHKTRHTHPIRKIKEECSAWFGVNYSLTFSFVVVRRRTCHPAPRYCWRLRQVYPLASGDDDDDDEEDDNDQTDDSIPGSYQLLSDPDVLFHLSIWRSLWSVFLLTAQACCFHLRMSLIKPPLSCSVCHLRKCKRFQACLRWLTLSHEIKPNKSYFCVQLWALKVTHCRRFSSLKCCVMLA